MKYSFTKTLFIINYSLLILLSSCSVSKQISKQANSIVLKDPAVATGHIGISIYEPATNKYWYNHNATHYFIPASNTKLFTLYAGMKYLGDSLVGLRYTEQNDTLFIQPAGDPTLLLSEYKIQNVFSFLKNSKKKILLNSSVWKDEILGNGWAWNDYMEAYMAGKSSLPIYGNLLTIKCVAPELFEFEPPYFKKEFAALDPEAYTSFSVFRSFSDNRIGIGRGDLKTKTLPFYPDDQTVINLLKDTIKKEISQYSFFSNYKNKLHSQPTDSLFKPMMHRSDNFFAEQTLLMASNEYLGYMSDEKIIDTILNKDLAAIPQRPKWVDGSGLSRYNLATPQSFVYLLNKMKNEFGLERLKVILPTGGEGTLSSYYKKNTGYIYAKTGTLSNNCALSGYIITNKGKLLIFSILANNYITGATPIRKAVELFLQQLLEKY